MVQFNSTVGLCLSEIVRAVKSIQLVFIVKITSHVCCCCCLKQTLRDVWPRGNPFNTWVCDISLTTPGTAYKYIKSVTSNTGNMYANCFLVWLSFHTVKRGNGLCGRVQNVLSKVLHKSAILIMKSYATQICEWVQFWFINKSRIPKSSPRPPILYIQMFITIIQWRSA